VAPFLVDPFVYDFLYGVLFLVDFLVGDFLAAVSDAAHPAAILRQTAQTIVVGVGILI